LDSEVSFRTERNVLVADVTRRPSERVKRLLQQQGIAFSTASIKFTVERSSANLGYIRFNDFAGLQLVKIETIRRPKRTKGREEWDGTFTYRRLMTTEEAFETCDEDKDGNGYLGREGLRLVLEDDKQKNKTTYHEGECSFQGNLRELIGVFRWHNANEAAQKEDHRVYPDSDLLGVGKRAHEGAS
jgi:hypothetical protein